MPRSLFRLKAELLHAVRRRRVDALLAGLSKPQGSPAAGTVLVDGVWDNPNYWVRYALFRGALDLAGAREVGVTGPWNAARVRGTLRRLGVRESVAFPSLPGRREDSRRQARALLSRTRTPEDVLAWEMPQRVPAAYVYDGILKRQKKGTVDLADPRLADHVAEALDCIDAAERLLDRYRFDLAVVTHQCNFLHTALVWLCIARRIPVVLLWGIYGSPRFTRLNQERHLWDCSDVPSREQLAALPPAKADVLSALGREYMLRRLGGRTSDSAAVRAYATPEFRVDRDFLAERFGWDGTRPVIAVYAPNWFDYPHSSGLTLFRDYQEWLQATLAFAVDDRRAYWLVKGHPWDDWYGGVTLRDLVPSLDGAPHVRLVPDDWNGRSVMETADALITCQGTAGIEFATLGKPVLVSDAGWYHDAGFVRLPGTREEYFEILGSEWWRGHPAREIERRAGLFAAFHFCHPDWQAGLLLPEDLEQWEIYAALPELLANGAAVIGREKALIREWWASGERGYHTYKMLRAEGYAG